MMGATLARQWRSNSGTVTAEFAVVLPAVLALIALVVGLSAFGMKAIELQHAAQMVAREMGRGSSIAEALAESNTNGARSQATVTRQAHSVCVSLRATYRVAAFIPLPITVRSCAPKQGL